MKEEEQAVYGIRHPKKSNNPIRLVFLVWVDIFRKLGKARSFKEGGVILFAGPGKYDPNVFKQPGSKA